MKLNLKTFTAASMAQALVAVRRQLGADAVILHTRTFKRGGIFGFGAQTVVEVTAADGREYGRQRRALSQRQRQGHVAAGRLGQGARPTALRAADAPAEARPPFQDATAGDLIRRTYAAARAEFQQSAAAAPAMDRPAAAPSGEDRAPARQASDAHGAGAPGEAQQLAEELRAVKRMVGRMMTQQKRHEPTEQRGQMPDKLFDQYLGLLEQEVAEELAGEIIDQVRSALTPEQLQDAQACRKAVADAVAQLVPTASGSNTDEARSDDGRPLTVALIGPTGVGKTTTIAKLAATFKLKQNKKVGLITLDTYRIAAVDQLKTYAGIIGVPLRVVMTPSELAEAVRQFQGCDVVLIDTAGRSQRDDPKLHELAAFLEAAQPHEVHLVLSSTCTQSVLMDTIDRFSKIRTDRIIFTKLDEAVTFGVVLNVMRKVRKRLSYITTGQEVPHQIEPGQPERLAALVVGEGIR